MKKTTILMTVIMIILSGALLTIGLLYSKSVEKYSTLESDLVEAVQTYVKVELNDQITDKLKISTKDMVKKGIIDKDILNIDGDVCSGSVMVTKTFDSLDYEADIKCKEYRTNQ